ncbi:hypothetical protein IWQ61_004950 [Dispira simplex]|nr:hypothetical protein IWQ61_004950 [Dispira simplex]
MPRSSPNKKQLSFLEKMKAFRSAKNQRLKERHDHPIVKDFDHPLPPPPTGLVKHDPKAMACMDQSVEPYSKLRISNRRVQPEEMHRKMACKRIVSLRQLMKSNSRQLETINWVTIGVVWEVGSEKTTKGNRSQPYRTLKLTDLQEHVVNLILFGSVAQFAQLAEQLVRGQIVAVLNPGLLQPTECLTTLGLSVDTRSQLLCVGTSPDLGCCTGRVSGNRTCPVPVNTTKGPLCVRHLEQSFKQCRASRMEFASGTSGMQLVDPDMPHVQGFKSKSTRRTMIRENQSPNKMNPRFTATAFYKTASGDLVDTGDPQPQPSNEPMDQAETGQHPTTSDFLMDQCNTGARYLREAKRAGQANPNKASSEKLVKSSRILDDPLDDIS